MKTFLSNIVLFIIGGYIILTVLGWFLDNHYKNYNNKYIDHKANWVFKKTGENLDYAIIGSSRAYNILDVLTINSTSHKNGINLASGGAAYSQNYVMLEKFLRHNSITNLIIAIDRASLTSKQSFSYPFSDYAFLPDFSDKTMEEAFFIESDLHKFLLWKYLPATKYMEFNNKYPFYKNFVLNKGKIEMYSNLESSRGTSLLKKNKKQLINNEDHSTKKKKKEWEIDSIDVYFLDKIISLCEQKGIVVFGYAAPCSSDIFRKHNYKEINNKIKQLLGNKNIKWLDYTSSTLSANKTLFADDTHLNAKGAVLFSIQLTNDLLKAGF